jgi:thiosulfate/3-mercaptopyruvate sulfurtransferase
VGHEPVAVLDGGLQAWQAAGGAVETAETTKKRKFTPSNFAIAGELVALTAINVVAENFNKSSQTILDARGAPRFRGEVEPLDPAAGHIPGALNRPFTENIDATGKFKPAEVPNILAMELAGLGRQALFAGSWSEWCSDPSRPVAQG